MRRRAAQESEALPLKAPPPLAGTWAVAGAVQQQMMMMMNTTMTMTMVAGGVGRIYKAYLATVPLVQVQVKVLVGRGARASAHDLRHAAGQ